MIDIIKKRINSFGLGELFCFFGAIISFVGIVFLFITNGKAAETLLWTGESVGVFPDLIESIYDAKTLSPYNDGAIYPALVYCLCFLFGRFLTADSVEWTALGGSPSAIIIGGIFFFTITVLVYKIISIILGKKFSSKTITIITVLLMLSPSYMYMIERGNMVALTMLLLLFYSCNYDSEKKVLREFAYIALASAAAMKIWPAVWGILLLKNKNIRGAIHSVLYGLILGIIPFMFMGGVSGISKMIDNITYLSTETVTDERNFGYGFKINIGNYVNAISDFYNLKQPENISNIIIVTVIVLVGSMFFIKKKWQVLSILAFILTMLPGFSWIYNAIYFIIPFVFFLKEEEKKSFENTFYLISFLLIFCIYPFGYIMGSLDGLNKISLSTFCNSLGAIMLLFTILGENIAALIKHIRICTRLISIAVASSAVVFLLSTFSFVEIGFARDMEVKYEKTQAEIADYISDYSSEKDITYEGLEGTGEKESPFLVSGVEDFEFLKYCVEKGIDFTDVYFEQKNDISFPDSFDFNPIGDYDSDFFFSGIYNGNGYRLSNINCIEKDNACIFLGLKGWVVNLVVSDSVFEGDNAGVITVGKGTSQSAIINCYSKNCTISGDYAASISDGFTGRVYNCVTDSKCYGSKETGLVTNYLGSDYNTYRIYGNIDIQNADLSEDDEEYIDSTHEIYLKALEIRLNNYSSKMFADGVDVANKVSLLNWNIDDSQLSMDRSFVLAGKGTSDEPYLIRDTEDLALFSEMVNAGVTFKNQYISQVEDIDLKNVDNFVPIGSNISCRFNGIYDGKGHVITNLFILSENNEDMALFGYMDGKIYNLNVLNAWIGGSQVGLIVCHGSGDVINCYGNGILYGYAGGGISYDSTGKIRNCVSIVNFQTEKKYPICYITKKTSNCFSINSEKSEHGTKIFDENSINQLNAQIKDLNLKEYVKINEWTNENGAIRVLAE